MGNTVSTAIDTEALTDTYLTLSRLVGPETIAVPDSFWYERLDNLELSVDNLDPADLTKLIEGCCETMFENDKKSGNFRNLLLVLALCLKQLPRAPNPVPDAVLNLLFLSRVFLRYFIEHLPPEQRWTYFTTPAAPAIDSQRIPEPEPARLPPPEIAAPSLPGVSYKPPSEIARTVRREASPRAPSSASSSLSSDQPASGEAKRPLPAPPLSERTDALLLPMRVVEELVNACIEIPLAHETYVLHTEMINLFMVFLCSEDEEPPSTEHNIFLQTLMHGPPRQRAAEYVQSLLFNVAARFSSRDAAHELTFTAGPTPGLLESLRSSMASLMQLPMKLYTLLFPPRPSQHSLSDRSAVFFLVLIHHGGAGNPYRSALKEFVDEDDTEDANGGVLPAHVLRLSFGKLYDALAICMPEEWAVLVLYSLLHGNQKFRDFVFAKSDLDVIVLPLLRMLYEQENLQTNRVYMVLIIFLILSQDAAFGENVHKRLVVPRVPWFKEHFLTRISLGSLMMVVLLRTLTNNLLRNRDPYLHSNCLAALANMAPHCVHIHPYAASRLVALLSVLSRKYAKLVDRGAIQITSQRSSRVTAAPPGQSAAARRRGSTTSSNPGSRTGSPTAGKPSVRAGSPSVPPLAKSPASSSPVQRALSGNQQRLGSAPPASLFGREGSAESWAPSLVVGDGDHELGIAVQLDTLAAIQELEMGVAPRSRAASAELSPSLETKGESTEYHESEIETFTEFIRLMLEIVTACLAPNNIAENVHLVYWMLHRRAVLLPFRREDKFWDLVENATTLITHFDVCLANAELSERSVDDVLKVLRSDARNWKGTVTVRQTKFTYEEQENSEEFFMPYIWDVLRHMPHFREFVGAPGDPSDSAAADATLEFPHDLERTDALPEDAPK